MQSADLESPAPLTFTVGSSTFRVAPQAGCRLMTWDVHTAAGNRKVLYWPTDSRDKPFAQIRGGNPILFPFSGRTYYKGIPYRWRAPDGEVRPMPRHGFARDGNFRIHAQTEHSLIADLQPTATNAAAYPFNYTFRVVYRFSELSLIVELELHNHDSVRIPWSAGHHFYFNLPWHPHARRCDYLLHLEARKSAYHNNDGALIRQKDRESCLDLGNPALIDRIHWELRHPRVSFGPKGGEEAVHIIFLPDDPTAEPSPAAPPSAHALVTWAPDPDCPFYCVEPWMGPPNAAEHKKGLFWVEPGDTGRFRIELSLF